MIKFFSICTILKLNITDPKKICIKKNTKTKKLTCKYAIYKKITL